MKNIVYYNPETKELSLEINDTDFSFTVIDNKTGEYPDIENIALYESWARNLIYCDIDGFSIDERGRLYLHDDCGNVAYPPKDRFAVNMIITKDR